jgi:hypothetical protein
MINCVNMIATLKDVDEKNPYIRYCLVRRPYPLFDENYQGDEVPLVNWNKDKVGTLFALKSDSLVAIKGRIENYSSRLVVVIETIDYLGLKG